MASSDLIDLGGDANEEALTHLQSMFPAVERAVIEMVFNDMADREMERAIEALLQITDDSVDPASAVSTEQTSADELVALQMLQMMMMEEEKTQRDADKVFRKIQSDDAMKTAFKSQTKGVRKALVTQLERMKARAMGKKSGESSTREYQQHYGALLDDDDPAMKV